MLKIFDSICVNQLKLGHDLGIKKTIRKIETNVTLFTLQ